MKHKNLYYISTFLHIANTRSVKYTLRFFHGELLKDKNRVNILPLIEYIKEVYHLENENFDPVQNQTNENLKNKGKEQVLEISSTGYGLESVSNDNSKKPRSNQSENH
jgi:hypothetical protein